MNALLSLNNGGSFIQLVLLYAVKGQIKSLVNAKRHHLYQKGVKLVPRVSGFI